MTTQDKVKKAIEEFDAKEAELLQLKEQMVAESGFEKGEKAEIWSKKDWRNNEPKFLDIGFIKYISVNNEAELKFSFKKMKKDGTPSSHDFGWGNVYSAKKNKKIGLDDLYKIQKTILWTMI